jgi:peptidyl-prolyl cis-trans isomerase A (cyclophilin A)
MIPLLPLVLAAAQAAASPAPDARPKVVMETSMGTLRIALEPEKAPLSTQNFLGYVRAGHYDGTVFHRLIPGFMAQGGGFDAQMNQKAVRAPIKNESANGLSNRRGTLAMARTNDPDSATAQFFINVVDNGRLDSRGGQPGYAVFGEVVGGMDVVDRIVAVPTTTRGPYENVPATPVVIKTARIEGEAARPAGRAPMRRPGRLSGAPREKPAPSPTPSPAP